MRKSLIALAVAGFAVATTSLGVATPAEAKGKGFGVGLGVGLVVGGIIASQHHRHHHHRRHVVTQPQPYPVATRPQAPAAPLIRTADDQGRFYDLASKTWFDGRSQCFMGTAAWTFKAGSWFYGTAGWGEKDGVWQASTGAAPTAVDCAGVPTIAARLPKQTVDKTAVVFKPSSEDHAAAIQGGQQATLGSGGEAASSN
jgi:hypothetical protein